MSRRRKGRAVSGVILLDKPAGLSSNQALQRVRRLFNARKAGHTGTLDPFATGMLPLCLGEASKTASFLMDSGKTYRATAALGIATTTGDLTGEPIQHADNPDLEDDQVRQLLASFEGESMQVPPMYSALKHEGKPLYEYARQGIVLDRKARPITIHRIELLKLATGTLSFEVSCSKGTYIRTLAEDIAARLGTCAHLSSLRRTCVEPFDTGDMLTLDELEAAHDGGTLDEYLLPIDAGLPDWPVVELDAERLSRFRHGNPVDARQREGAWVRVHSPEGTPCGLGEISDGCLLPRRVFVSG